MPNWIQTLIAALEWAWPFKIVHAWEAAVYLVRGRVWRHWPADRTGRVGPGLYFAPPFITRVVETSVVPDPVSTTLQDITLQDGTALTFSATAVLDVVNVVAAITEVDSFRTSAVELLSAILAEKLADVDRARLDPPGRKRLIADLVRWVDAETQKFGVRVCSIRFTNFVLNSRRHRLLMDKGTFL